MKAISGRTVWFAWIIVACLPRFVLSGEGEQTTPGTPKAFGHVALQTSGDASTVAMSQDGSRIAAICGDGRFHRSSSVMVWSARTGQLISKTQLERGDAGPLDFSSQDALLAAHEWRALHEGTPRPTKPEHAEFALSAAGDVVVYRIKGQAHDIVYHHGTDRVIGRVSLQGNNDRVPRCDVTRDGRWCAQIVSPESVHVHDTKTGQVIHELQVGHPNASVRAIAFSQDCQKLAVGNELGYLIVFDVQSGRILHRLWLGQYKRIAAVAFSPQNNRVAASDDQAGQVYSWSLPDGKPFATISTKIETVRQMVFAPDGTRLLLGGDSRNGGTSVQLLDTETGQDCLGATGASSPIARLVYSPDSRLIATFEADQQIHVWDADSARLLTTYPGDARGDLRFSEDSWSLGAVNLFGEYNCWHAQSGRPLVSQQGTLRERNFSSHQCLSADLATVVRLTDRHGLMRTGLLNREQHWSVNLADGLSGEALALSPDGRSIASICERRDGRERVYVLNICRAEPGELVQKIQLPAEIRQGECLTYSPDGTKLLFTSGDSVVVLHADTGESFRVFKSRSDVAAFTYDGASVVIPSEDGIEIIELITGKRQILLAFPSAVLELTPTSRFRSPVRSLVTSPDGRLMAATFEGQPTFWTWPLNPEGWNATPPTAEMSPVEFANHWQSLQSDNSAAAYESIWILAKHGSATVDRIAERIFTTDRVLSVEQVQNLIGQLNHDDFDRRQLAQSQLIESGPKILPTLREALAQQLDPETDGRLKAIIQTLADRDDAQTASLVAFTRAIQVLERIGSKESATLLKKISIQGEDVSRQSQAKSAWQRVERRLAGL